MKLKRQLEVESESDLVMSISEDKAFKLIA